MSPTTPINGHGASDGSVVLDLPKTTARQSSRAVFLLPGIILLGAVLRLVSINGTSINPDEFWIVSQSEKGVKYLLETEWKTDIHPPLNFVFTCFWLKLGQQDWWLRLPYFVASLVTVYAIFLLGKELMSTEGGWIGSFLFVISPFSVLYSNWAKQYAFVTLLTVLCVYCFSRGCREGKNRWWGALAAMEIVGMYIHYSMLLLILGLNGAYLVLKLSRQSAPALKQWFLIQGIVVLGFLPWAPMFLDQILSGRDLSTASALVNVNRALKVFYYLYCFCLGESVTPHNYLIVVPAVVLFGFVFLKGALRLFALRPHAVILLGFFLIPFVIGSLKHVTYPKHLYFIFPAFCLILAQGILVCESKGLRSFLLAGIVGASAYSLSNLYQGQQMHSTPTPWREIAATVENQIQPGDVIVIFPEDDTGIHKLTRYFRRYYNNTSQNTIVPIGYLERAEAEKQIAEIVARLPDVRVWAVLHYGGSSVTERHRQLIQAQLAKKYQLAASWDFAPDEHFLNWIQGSDGDEARFYNVVELRGYKPNEPKAAPIHTARGL